MVELTAQDWERAKAEAEGMLKQALIMLEVNTNLLGIAEARIKELTPPETPKTESKDASPSPSV